MKSFVIEDSFWEVFPKVEIGIVCVDGILPASQIADESAKRAARLLDHANDSAERWISSNTISQNEVVAVWRDAYKRFKTKKGARVSVENLIKRVMKDNPVRHIKPCRRHLQRHLAQVCAAHRCREHRCHRG